MPAASWADSTPENVASGSTSVLTVKPVTFLNSASTWSHGCPKLLPLWVHWLGPSRVIVVPATPPMKWLGGADEPLAVRLPIATATSDANKLARPALALDSLIGPPQAVETIGYPPRGRPGPAGKAWAHRRLEQVVPWADPPSWERGVVVRRISGPRPDRPGCRRGSSW